jgi:hypothetical protein
VEVEVPVKVRLEPVRRRRATAEVVLMIEKRVVTHCLPASYRVLAEDAQSLVPCLGSIVSVEQQNQSLSEE